MFVQTDVYEPNVIMEYFFNINVIFTPRHSSLLELVMDFSTVVWRQNVDFDLYNGLLIDKICLFSWWCLTPLSTIFQLSGADPGFKVREGVLKKKIAPSGGRRENYWGISCENSRYYAKKADYRISLLPLTSNSKNKTVVSKLHSMSNL